MPWLPLVNDFKQGLFYASLMIFWLVFAGEHLLNDDGKKIIHNQYKEINLFKLILFGEFYWIRK